MPEYNFVLHFALAKEDLDQDAIVERLGRVGCTDATVGIGRAGYIAFDFTRDADSEANAVCSAVADVKKSIPSAVRLQDLDGLTR